MFPSRFLALGPGTGSLARRGNVRLEHPSADPEWERHAACKGEDAALFFGPTGFEPKRDRERRESIAKSVCARCPVADPCREMSISQGEVYGVWGGLGELERRAILTRLEGLAG